MDLNVDSNSMNSDVLRLSQQINAAFYATLSSARNDSYWAISPGGYGKIK